MEIERKFLTKELPFDITAYPCKAITQAYLSFSPTIRIRQSNADYILTVKGKGHLARVSGWNWTMKCPEKAAISGMTAGRSLNMPVM